MTADSDRRSCCDDCGAPLTASLTTALAARPGLPAPRRCPACRDRWLTVRNGRLAAAYAAGANGPVAAGASGPEAGATYPAVCADCRRDIRVPFVPREDRPVFCRRCLAARTGR